MAESIVIFHYHLFPGGVTSVIRKGIEAISQYSSFFSEFTIVVGYEEYTSSFIRDLSPLINSQGITVEVKVEPAIGYAGKEDGGSSKELGDYLYGKYGGPAWWIHNYHVGKNPFFTGALLYLVDTHGEQLFTLQIHDFPECGRYENLRFLKSRIPNTPIYPIGDNVRYALINRRDYRVLLKAGVPENQLFYLPNPLGCPKATLPDKELARKKLFDLKGDSVIGNLGPQGEVFLYPVRTIRRKNVLEAGFITTVREQTNLLATLPGSSDSEIAYSNGVAECFKTGTIAGLWGIGRSELERDISFPEIIASSNIVISSSVQEGFGYFFLEALEWKRPLLARRLDILEDFFEIFKDYPLHLYDSFVIPLSKDKIQVLLEQYRNFIEELRDILPEKIREGLYHQLIPLQQEGLFEFSFLPVEEQQKQLILAQEEEYRRQIKEINAPLFKGVELITNTPNFSDFKEEKLYSTFGYKPFAQRTEDLFTLPQRNNQSAKQSTLSTQDPADIESSVLSLFSKPEFIRLLYR